MSLTSISFSSLSFTISLSNLGCDIQCSALYFPCSVRVPEILSAIISEDDNQCPGSRSLESNQQTLDSAVQSVIIREAIPLHRYLTCGYTHTTH